MTKTIDALVEAREALELARGNLRDHGDNCFLHDEGEYNACFCGKDSLVNHLQSVVEKSEAALAQARAEQAEPQPEHDGPIVDGWQLSVAEGHSGHGVYAHMTEYPDEGAVLVLPITPRAEQAEPFGRVTIVRRPGHVDAHFFYPHPQPPYLDNAAECHTVYTTPPAAPVAKLEPLTDAEIDEEFFYSDSPKISPIQRARIFARAVEAAHNAKLGGVT